MINELFDPTAQEQVGNDSRECTFPGRQKLKKAFPIFGNRYFKEVLKLSL